MADSTQSKSIAAPEATLLISSRNYSSWSLRGFLLARLSGLAFSVVAADSEAARDELLLRSSSILLPTLRHDGLEIWDTIAIAEYLNERFPKAGMLPEDRAARARCRSIAGEMHSGFAALRSSLPMNLKARRRNFALWSAPRADIARIEEIWHDCLERWGGPYLFGDTLTIADAMYAPVVTRFVTYDVKLDERCRRYGEAITAWPDMVEWTKAAIEEPEEMISELEVEF